MSIQTFRLVSAEARARAIEAIRTAPDGLYVKILEESRSLEQNAAQWPILTAFAQQLVWPINGRMEKLVEEEWKDILTATFQGESARLAPTLNGRGFVMLGLRTSKMGKRVFSEYLDFLHATAVDRDVKLPAREGE